MKKRVAAVALVLMMLGVTGIALGQGAEVTGEVYRGDRPLVNCTVSIGQKFGFTDVYGRFRISNVPAGQYTLVVSQGQTKLKEISVQIGNSSVNLPRIRL